MGLNLDDLRRVNVARSVEDFKHRLNDWSVAEWGNALAGEAGEACNFAKKLLRFRSGVAGNHPDLTPEVLRQKLGREIADVVIYADLWAASEGMSLSELIVEKFNAKSDEIGSSKKLRTEAPDALFKQYAIEGDESLEDVLRRTTAAAVRLREEKEALREKLDALTRVKRLYADALDVFANYPATTESTTWMRNKALETLEKTKAAEEGSIYGQVRSSWQTPVKGYCVRCGSPYKPQGCCSQEGCQGGRGENAAESSQAARMDAPDGPVCGCGKPSTHQSGWCGTDCYCTTCGLLKRLCSGCKS